MKHVQPFTKQRPIAAQMDGGDGEGNLLIKSILSFLLFGINPLFLLAFGSKTDNGGTNTGGGSN